MAHAKRKFSVKPAVPLNSDINVTPLVDVVLVLLIIFMVVTPLLEKDIGVRVPEKQEVEEFDEVPQDQLVVRVNAAGEFLVNADKVERLDLTGKLKSILDRRKRPEDKIVFVVADEGANYGNVVGVLDSARQAGAETLGMMTDVAAEEPKAPQAP